MDIFNHCIWVLCKELDMADLLYIGLTLVFLAASWGFIVFCDRLMENKK
jgi:hypothetical protein